MSQLLLLTQALNLTIIQKESLKLLKLISKKWKAMTITHNKINRLLLVFHAVERNERYYFEFTRYHLIKGFAREKEELTHLRASKMKS